MKTILVATDFSPAAHDASLYAAEVAQIFSAKLILFNAYQQVPVTAIETPVIITREDMRTISRSQLENEAKEINLWNTINVETRYEEGLAADNIMKAAKEVHADIIIAGMKARGKGFRKMLGSTVTAMIRKTTIPVIVVPEKAIYTRLNTIALANESDLEPDADVHLMDALREIAARFQPKLYMVRIAKDQFREAFDVLNPPSILIRSMHATDPIYKCIQGKHVSEGLNSFIREYHVDMLAMLSHKHSLLERWFTKSATHEMVFETDIPLLILPDLPKTNSREY